MKNFFTFISRPKKTQAQANRASEAYLRHVAALSSQDVLKEVAGASASARRTRSSVLQNSDQM